MHQDYLIVGQGIAGTLLAYFLQKKGKTVHVIDNAHHEAASRVAAGIINPITGRRYVKSWRIEEFLPFAEQTYQAIEKEFDLEIFHKRNILRTLAANGEENSWLARANDEAYQKYMLTEFDSEEFVGKVKAPFSYGELEHSYQVEIGELVSYYQEKLRNEKNILIEKFDFEALNLSENKVEYKGLEAEKIIFCDGALSRFNPYFTFLLWQCAKGEVLIVKIPNANFKKIYKDTLFIVPLEVEEENLYWVGSFYIWEFENAAPSEEDGNYLRQRFEAVIDMPYEIREHKAGVRPVVKDRRPYLGLHPDFPQIGIFNGLGTKGASLAPYFAHHMAEFLVGNVEIEKEVDVRREKK